MASECGELCLIARDNEEYVTSLMSACDESCYSLLHAVANSCSVDDACGDVRLICIRMFAVIQV